MFTLEPNPRMLRASASPGVWAAGGFLAVYSYWFAVYCGAVDFAKRFFSQALIKSMPDGA